LQPDRAKVAPPDVALRGRHVYAGRLHYRHGIPWTSRRLVYTLTYIGNMNIRGITRVLYTGPAL
jgi:hypothetical protein